MHKSRAKAGHIAQLLDGTPVGSRPDMRMIADLVEGVGEEAAGTGGDDPFAGVHDGPEAEAGDTGDGGQAGRSWPVSAAAAVVAQEGSDLVGRQEHGTARDGAMHFCVVKGGLDHAAAVGLTDWSFLSRKKVSCVVSADTEMGEIEMAVGRRGPRGPTLEDVARLVLQKRVSSDGVVEEDDPPPRPRAQVTLPRLMFLERDWPAWWNEDFASRPAMRSSDSEWRIRCRKAGIPIFSRSD